MMPLQNLTSLEILYNDLNFSFDIDNESLSFFNFPISDVYKVIQENAQGSYLGLTAQVVLSTIYIILSVLGFLWNVLIVFVIIRKSELRTPRNWYIINLTISDVAMCVISMPFTLIGLLKKNWTLGSVICKLIPAVQCTNILVSTATIVAIAADRYRTILSVGCRSQTQLNIPCSMVMIWIASLAFTCPLFIFYSVERVMLRDIFLYDKCTEDWKPPIIKVLWTICLLLIQYVIPILVLSFVHIKINRFLSLNKSSERDPRRLHREMERNRRTTKLLTSVAVSFAVSWLPWHVVNFLADFHYPGFKEPEYFYSVFGVSHLIAMSTACTNPILYGWLNTTLKKELSILTKGTLKKFNCKSSKKLGTFSNPICSSKQKPPKNEDIKLHIIQQEEKEAASVLKISSRNSPKEDEEPTVFTEFVKKFSSESSELVKKSASESSELVKKSASEFSEADVVVDSVNGSRDDTVTEAQDPVHEFLIAKNGSFKNIRDLPD